MTVVPTSGSVSTVRWPPATPRRWRRSVRPSPVGVASDAANPLPSSRTARWHPSASHHARTQASSVPACLTTLNSSSRATRVIRARFSEPGVLSPSITSRWMVRPCRRRTKSATQPEGGLDPVVGERGRVELGGEQARLADGLVDVAPDPVGDRLRLVVAGEQAEVDLDAVEDLLDVVVQDLGDPLALAELGLGERPGQRLDLVGPGPERLRLLVDAPLELGVEPLDAGQQVPHAELLPAAAHGERHDGPEGDRADRPFEHGHAPPPARTGGPPPGSRAWTSRRRRTGRMGARTSRARRPGRPRRPSGRAPGGPRR